MTEILTLNNVTFSYAPNELELRNAVEGVSFTVNRGEWISIIGHNGSGKSTIAKLICALLFPKQGEVRILNEVVNEHNLWDKRALIGVVFQNPDNQFVGATVQDDVAFALENKGIPYHDMVSRVHEALEQVNMMDFIDHEPHHLSGGQKQRVAIAGALAFKPQLLILDEATSMLDPLGRADVLQTVRQLRADTNLTVLSITHDLEEVLLADRVVLMHEGKKYAEGTPAEIFALGDQLIQFGLDLPFATRMTKLLQQQGVCLNKQHITEEELVKDLWISNFNK